MNRSGIALVAKDGSTDLFMNSIHEAMPRMGIYFMSGKLSNKRIKRIRRRRDAQQPWSKSEWTIVIWAAVD
ncbi:hypothetical protein PSP6_130225 [Paraburkholderia tropica]|nr:hypothetical protein PSP6_130225 [Paraburkholderia tropica]